MARTLDGILVVSLEQAVAAPFATSRLADAGARVIKVERAEGDFARAYDGAAHGSSAFFVWLNRGKESITLDIKDADEVALAQRIIERADVLVQNLAPGAAARAGLGSAAMCERNPRLVACDISGYGEDGPYARMKAYDLLVQAETGLASITGTPEAPGRVGVSICDIASGMYAQIAILEALYERERTGRGRALAISMFDSLADWMTVPLLCQELAGAAPARTGMHHALIAPYGTFATAGGDEVVLAVQNEREWRSFCETALERPGLAEDPRFASNAARLANAAALTGAIEAVLGALPRAAAVERLAAARIAYGSLNTVADLSAHPQLRRAPVETPAGTVDLVASPIRRSEDPHALGAVPALGAHDQAIRREFGPG